MARRAGPLAEISPGDAEISASGLEKFSYKTRHPGNRAENYHSAHVKFADHVHWNRCACACALEPKHSARLPGWLSHINTSQTFVSLSGPARLPGWLASI